VKLTMHLHLVVPRLRKHGTIPPLPHGNMADRTMSNSDDTPVFINNSSERSELMCASCDKFKTNYKIH
jgi:hypothetical protein